MMQTKEFSKQLPNNESAERFVISEIINDNELYWEVAGVLKAEYFYTPFNRTVFGIIETLANIGEPIRETTIADHLVRSGSADASASFAQLSKLLDNISKGVPRDDIIFYARLVAQKAKYREKIKLSTLYANLLNSGEIEEASRIKESLLDLEYSEADFDFHSANSFSDETLEKIYESGTRKSYLTGISSGFQKFDRMTCGLQNSDLIIVGARPSVGKTSWTLNIAEFAAIHFNKSVGIVSLEMSKTQLLLRLYSSLAFIPLQVLRSGRLSKAEWARLIYAVDKVNASKIFINEASMLNPLQLRASAKRLKRSKSGLDLLLVDYIQLMDSGRKSESLRTEVTYISRQLKVIAKELNIPVMALSQLSRAPDKRADHKPAMADLRECVTDTTFLTAHDGSQKSIKYIKPGDKVLSISADQKSVLSEVEDVWSTGIQNVFEVTMSTGKVLECTANHPFLTERGFIPLSDIKDGELVATNFRIEQELGTPRNPELCRFLGYMLGNGTYKKHRGIGFCSNERAVVEDVVDIIKKNFPKISFTYKKKIYENFLEVYFVQKYENGYGKPYGNSLLEWMKSLDIVGQDCYTKRVPEYVMTSSKKDIAEFIAGYLATDGCVTKTWDIRFDTVSPGLAKDIQYLLSRLGISSFIKKSRSKHHRLTEICRITVTTESRKVFKELIKPKGKKQNLLDDIREKDTRSSSFCLPTSVSKAVSLVSKYEYLGKKINRNTLRKYTFEPNLLKWADSDLIWEKIKSITPIGQKETFDIRIKETHNFVANGIVVHNSGSLEADADLICFLYREELYNPDPKYKGRAEILLSKQRNGPTGTIPLIFHGDYTRFSNFVVK